MSDARLARVSRVAGLYAVTPDSDDAGVLLAKVIAAVQGGAAVVQYRDKAIDAPMRRAQARALASAPLVRRALFIVNDDPDLARIVDADGVHLGEDDASIAQARACVGPDRLVGISCYDDFDRARAAVAEGADYVAFGSFFPSPVKPGARRANPGLLVRARALGVPVVAIGGITAANAPALIDAGATALAVISDVFAHESPDAIARAAAAIARLCHAQP
jgi:thiamine-phosphate pyrophosphorylase